MSHHSLTHLVLFIKIQINSSAAFLLVNSIYIHQYVHIYICILFALTLKNPTMLYEDVKMVCKVISSLVKQNIVCWFYFLTCVSIANEICQWSAKILFTDISEILRQKQQLSVSLIFSNLLSPIFISPIMSNPLQSESASS